MKQKIIISFSLVLLILAIYMIARDLFRQSPSAITTACCTDEFAELKKFDTTLIAYNKIKTIETGLKNLSGLSVSESGIFVTGGSTVATFDTAGNRIAEFSTDSITGSITVSGDDIFITSGLHIFKYNTDGELLQTITGYPDSYITSVAVSEGQLYAADAINKRVLKYSPEGSLILEIGAKDSITEAPGFIIPSLYFDIAFDGFGRLWVVNPGRLRVENYTTTGYMQSFWGIASASNEGFSGCCNPAHITVLPNGSFVTYEKGTDKIKVFDPTGSFVCYVGGAGSFRGDADFQTGGLNLVNDITSDTEGNIYVLDVFNTINIFREKGL